MAVVERSNVIERPSAGAEGAAAGGQTQWALADYSFAADGGAVGNINLLSSALPSGAVILGGYLEVLTPPTSGGAATLGISSEGAGDLVAPVVISGAPWSTAGRKSVIPAFTGATTVKLTAARNIVAVIGVAALTAGAFRVAIAYVLP